MRDLTEFPLDWVLMDGISDMIFVMEVEDNTVFRYKFINRAAMDITGLGEKHLGKTIEEVYPPGTELHFLKDWYAQAMESNKNFTYRDKFMDQEGKLRYSKNEMKPLFDKNGTCRFIVSVVKDITDTWKASKKLEESEKRFRIIAENAHDLITLLDENGEIIYISPSYERTLGYGHKEFIGKSFLHNVHSEDVYHLTGSILESIREGETFTVEFKQHTSNDEMKWFESNGTPVFDENNVFEHMVVLTRDIDIKKQYEAQLEYSALHDKLTNLPNRSLFDKEFIRVKEAYEINKNELAVLMLDIDHFKEINDTFGHDAGDKVIKEFSNRILAAIRDVDTVARLGGDEFVIVMPSLLSIRTAEKVAGKIMEAMEKPFRFGEQELSVTTSIGISLSHSQDITQSMMMKQADIALYAAKDAGRNYYHVYEA